MTHEFFLSKENKIRFRILTFLPLLLGKELLLQLIYERNIINFNTSAPSINAVSTRETVSTSYIRKEKN